MSHILSTPFLLELLAFSLPCWITNLSFQFIRAVKDKVPRDSWLRTHNIDAFDFKFIDNKPFVGGGVRVSSIVPILILPLIFNFFLPVSFFHYLLLTSCVFTGDLLGSFIKRRFNYKKGEYMPLVDHGDYILFTGFIFVQLNLISYSIFVLSLLITYILHPLVCVIGYKLRIKNQIL
jgi:CDP-2,3-bis-(O-geranylgeranyl)-sn-glycerol synthase